MNRTITFPNLVSELSALTSSNDATSDKFIRSLFAAITEALTRGESIDVPGIGRFSPTHDPANPVIWTPDETLAATVNEPFACFEPVELGEGVTEELLSTPDNEPSSEPVTTEAEAEIPPVPTTPVIPPIPSVNIETAAVEEEAPAEETEPQNEEIIAETPSSEDYSVSEEQYPEEEEFIESKRSSANPVIMLIIGLIIGAAAGYFAGRYYGNTTQEPASTTEPVAETDQIADISHEEPADTLATDTITTVIADPTEITVEKAIAVTDTVTRNRYLTTMARQYYGDYRFWVYIYEENIDHLQNPNRIKPGTPITIPPASKYGIDANDAESVAKAEKRIAEISKKYPQ